MTGSRGERCGDGDGRAPADASSTFSEAREQVPAADAAVTTTADGRRVKEDGTIVHPQAEALFAVCPWVRMIPVIGHAVEGYGPLFVVSLNTCYFLLKGVADNIIVFSRQPMLVRRFGLDGTRYQRLASLYSMGWAIKAFIAMLTDAFAFLGYTKRWYMFASCIGGAAFALGYGLLPAQPSSGNPAAAFIFLTSFGKSNVDILSEGHYSRLIRRNPVPGPSLVSSIWVCILFGTLIASVIQGPLSDSGKMQVGVFISAALQFVSSIFFVFNWYGEKTNRVERLQDMRDTKAALAKARAEARVQRSSSEEEGDCALHEEPTQKDLHPEREPHEAQPGDQSLLGLEDVVADAGKMVTTEADADEEAELQITTCLFGAFEVNKEVLERNWKVVAYCIIMTCSVVTMVCVTILGTSWDLMYACIVLTVVCIVTAFLTLPIVIAKANVFLYSYFLLYISLPGALDSFYLADAACLPGGPHFSYVFYNTVSAVISNIGGIVGVTIFTYVFSKMNYQVTLCVAVSLQILASVFDLIMVERWNLAIGIPDHAMYICGDTIIYQVCYMLSYMPVVLLISRLCPRGSESMIYALMAGFANLGSTMSNAVGSLLIEFRFPIKTTVPCDFSNVRWLIIIGHLGMPAAIVPLSFLLLPRARICDDIDVNGHAIHAQMKAEAKEAAKTGEAARQPEN
ncbi:putative pteridine transporter [Novymonas esmeraldas]|uniref:Pteridine transporter n=1 Tax=Novymonas esmeraldas TaxID=1808958 RepID=A0AAW0ESU6_9TRYP